MTQPKNPAEAANVADFEIRVTKKSIVQNRQRQGRGRVWRVAVLAFAPLALLALSSAQSAASDDAELGYSIIRAVDGLGLPGAYSSAGGNSPAAFEMPDPGPGGISFTFSYTVILLPGYPYSLGAATSQSADGTTVVGYLNNASYDPYHAFRKMNTDDTVDLGTLDPANNDQRADKSLTSI
jgi:hypothetical protein